MLLIYLSLLFVLINGTMNNDNQQIRELNEGMVSLQNAFGDINRMNAWNGMTDTQFVVLKRAMRRIQGLLNYIIIQHSGSSDSDDDGVGHDGVSMVPLNEHDLGSDDSDDDVHGIDVVRHLTDLVPDSDTSSTSE